MRLITPSAVTVTGTGSSATINVNGSVSFTAAVTLQLEGVFSSTYDNYQIVCRGTSNNTAGGGGKKTLFQIVYGSTPDATASSYVAQTLEVDASATNGVRNAASTSAEITTNVNTQPAEGFVMFIYGPNLAQPTVGRSLSVSAAVSGKIAESAWTHNVSSAFDGMYLNFQGNGVGGRIAVYGMRK